MPRRRRTAPASLATLLTALALLSTTLSPASRAEETDCEVRDPSTVVKRDGVYWLYGTGQGVMQFSSKDRRHWTFRGPVFPTRPAWAGALTSNKDGIAWAPDVHFWGGRYYLYYSYSFPGSKVSGIGVATNATLDPKGWVDQGVVVHSGQDTGFNTIDPCIFEDAGGAKWLSFGSYFDGIHVVRIDPATGKTMAGDAGRIYDVARHPQSSINAIEASAVTYHAGWYYLFVNWDGCCAGARSTYNVRVGRSRVVTGPYRDREGKDLRDGGGSLFLNAVFDDGSGRPCDDEVGPGHVGILSDADGDWLGTHYEWARDRKGATTVNLQKLAWDSDGWPRAVLDPGPYRVVSALASHGVVSAAANDSPLQTQPYGAARGQRWTLRYLGDGYYNLLDAASGKALGLAGDATKPGAKTVLAPPKGSDAQIWYLRQNEDGTYTLLSKSTDRAAALDITGCSLADGTPLQQWTDNGLPCQKFSFRR